MVSQFNRPNNVSYRFAVYVCYKSNRQERSEKPNCNWGQRRHKTIDSLVSSLRSRFSSNNSAQFNLFYLHPKMMQGLQVGLREEYRNRVAVIIVKNYIRLTIWNTKWWAGLTIGIRRRITKTLDLADLLQQCRFFPAVRQAVLLLLTLGLQ